MKLNININIRINRVVKFLVLSDLLFLGGWSLISPIFPLFIVDKIKGATLITVSMTAALYWLVKSTLQIPVANFLDKTDGEKDDFYALILGLTLASLSSFSFALTSGLPQLFLTQFVYAVSMALYIPSWAGIFSRHLDEKRFAFDWSLDSTVVGLTSFLTALLGGVLARWFGFPFVFFAVGVSSLLSTLFIFFTPDLIIPKKTAKTPPPPKDHI